MRDDREADLIAKVSNSIISLIDDTGRAVLDNTGNGQLAIATMLAIVDLVAAWTIWACAHDKRIAVACDLHYDHVVGRIEQLKEEANADEE